MKIDDDPFIEEIRRNRQEHAAHYGNDLSRICQALRKREAQSDRKVVHRAPRRLLQSSSGRTRKPK